MPEQLAASTLELVVNEQQLQNMSQIDLSSGGQQQHQSGNTSGAREECQKHGALSACIRKITRWPDYIKKSFTSKMDEAKSKSDTKLELVYEIVRAFASTITWFLCLLATILLPKFLFIIGLVNLENCPCQPALPRLVLTLGFVINASNMFNFAMRFDLPILRRHTNLSAESKDIVSSIVNIIFNCVVTFIYIFLAFYVYKMDRPIFDDGSPPPTERRHYPNNNINNQTESATGNHNSTMSVDFLGARHHSDSYCDSFLYHFTFWFITSSLIVSLGVAIVVCMSVAYTKYRTRTSAKDRPSAAYDNQNSFHVES